MNNEKKAVTRTMTIPTSSEEAYERLYDEIAAVPDDQMTRIASDIDYSHRIVVNAAPKIELHFPQLEQLAFYDMELVCKTRLYADACWQAHLIVANPLSLDPHAPALIDEASKLRARMLASAELLVIYGLAPAEPVAAIRAGQGNVDTIHDLKHLPALFRKLSKELRGKVFVTDEMIARASALAEELAHMFGIREFGPVPDLNHPQRMRQKAYTLLVRAYDECRRGIGFIRAPYGDADEIAPSLFLKQRKRVTVMEQDVDTVEPAPTTEAPAPTSTPAPVVSTNNVSTA